MNRVISGYAVGALMYCPANMHGTIVESLEKEQFGKPFSLAFCLEDTVHESAVEEAEQYLYRTLESIQKAKAARDFYMPLIFIRIRSVKQLEKLASVYSVFSDILTGFIIPKFFIENCDAYIEVITKLKNSGYHYYYMPIFESASMIDLSTRHKNLSMVKHKLEAVQESVLNIRVGGNDLSHAFSIRRPVNHTIYDVKPVADILIDIVTTYGTTYVISGPVWEYYAGEGWDTGLKRELELDLLSGFIGKTVIHPKQIAIVNEALKVKKSDYEDACQILNWDRGAANLVSANIESMRMNEYNTHHRWAVKMMQLAQIYGIKEIS